jgi:hypothetical protein
MLVAFNGQAETRAAALVRLDGYLESNRLTSGALFWNGTTASVASALIESDDLQSWQEQLGLAKWLAYALDLPSGTLPPFKCVEIAKELLYAIPVGCDTSATGSRVIVGVLFQVTARLSVCRTDVAMLKKIAEEIRGMHEQVVVGHTHPESAWRLVRKAATNLTNAFEGGLERAIGACVEAAAWDPAAAPTTVGGVLMLWIQACSTHLDEQFGWTSQDNERIQTLLKDMFDTFKKDRPEEERDVFMLLRAHHPEVEDRMMAYTQYKRAEADRICVDTLRLLVAIVRDTLNPRPLCALEQV